MMAYIYPIYTILAIIFSMVFRYKHMDLTESQLFFYYWPLWAGIIIVFFIILGVDLLIEWYNDRKDYLRSEKEWNGWGEHDD